MRKDVSPSEVKTREKIRAKDGYIIEHMCQVAKKIFFPRCPSETIHSNAYCFFKIVFIILNSIYRFSSTGDI